MFSTLYMKQFILVVFLLLHFSKSIARNIQEIGSTSAQFTSENYSPLRSTSPNYNKPKPSAQIERYYINKPPNQQGEHDGKRTTNQAETVMVKRRRSYFEDHFGMAATEKVQEVVEIDPLLFIVRKHAVELTNESRSPGGSFREDSSSHAENSPITSDQKSLASPLVRNLSKSWTEMFGESLFNVEESIVNVDSQGKDSVETDHRLFEARPVDFNSIDSRFISTSGQDQRSISQASQMLPFQSKTILENIKEVSMSALHNSNFGESPTNDNVDEFLSLPPSSSIGLETIDDLEDPSKKYRSLSVPFDDENITWEPYPFSGVFDHLMTLNNSIIILPPNSVTRNDPFLQPFSSMDQNNRGEEDKVRIQVNSTSTTSSPLILFDSLGGSLSGHQESLARNEGNFISEINNPENFTVSPPPETKVFQTPVGGRCFYLEPNFEGVCVALSECPVLQTLADQFQNRQIKEFFQLTLCRMTESEMFFCCPSYQSSAWLPGGRTTIVPLPEKSPHPAPLLPPGQCGQVKVRAGRIRGGVVVNEGEWPWLATLGRPVSKRRFISICTGSLITRRHVLTAAHCQRGAAIDQSTHVRLGEIDLEQNTDPLHQEYLISSFHAPLYHFYFAINDIMLLTLDEDVTFTDYVQPGCLPINMLTAPVPGDPLTVVGYGLLEEETLDTAVVARYPQSLEVTVRETRFCQQAYSDTVPQLYIIDDRTFCEGGEANKSACKGDSGGPVNLWDEASQTYVIVGVTNARFGCGVEDSPSIHLRVGAFMPWIRSVIGG